VLGGIDTDTRVVEKRRKHAQKINNTPSIRKKVILEAKNVSGKK
jgi:hypothetical protein